MILASNMPAPAGAWQPALLVRSRKRQGRLLDKSIRRQAAVVHLQYELNGFALRQTPEPLCIDIPSKFN